MIQIFVQSNDENGELLVASHHEFAAVPRVGEDVVVDEDDQQYLLTVVGVSHHAQAKGDFQNSISGVHLACKFVSRFEA
ncbi:MAG: hypothetical protein AAGK01_14535 [Pseudomonadota bacterium]